MRSWEIANTGIGNRVDVSELQEDFGTLWFVYKNRFKGISCKRIVASDLMNVANLSVNVGCRERLRWRRKNVIETLVISEVIKIGTILQWIP
jgi:hypothetical protein